MTDRTLESSIKTKDQTASARISLKSPIKFSKNQSSLISLNFEDKKILMKKKQKQYQNELQIQDAQRVHDVLVQMEQEECNLKDKKEKEKKREQKQQLLNYKIKTINQFREYWDVKMDETLKDLEKIQLMMERKHMKEIKMVKIQIEDIDKDSTTKLKYSKMVLELQDQFLKLTKLQEYKQADTVQKRLYKIMQKQKQKYKQQTLSRKIIQFQQLKQKHNKQKSIAQERHKRIYHHQQEQKQRERDKLEKNINTYEIDSNKIELKVKRTLNSRRTSKIFERKVKGGDSLIELAVSENRMKQQDEKAAS